MSQLFAVSLDEKIAELKREIEKRKDVFGRMVAERRMTKATAERRIAILEAVLADYQEGKVQCA